MRVPEAWSSLDAAGMLPAPVMGQPGMLPMANGVPVPVMGNQGVVNGMIAPPR